MFSAGPKLSEIYATPKPELPDDDLSFLRSMIEKPPPPVDPIDYDFLKNELTKRRPVQQPKPKGIELLEPQVKPSNHVPKYLKTKSEEIPNKTPDLPRTASRGMSVPSEELIVQMTPAEENFQSLKPSQEELINEGIREISSPAKPAKPAKKPKKYVSWKYVGDMDGELGVLSGKLDVEKEKENGRNIASDFANLPYMTNTYKKPVQPKVKKPKVKPRDLFKLSIAKESREAAKQRSITALRNERRVIDDFDPANSGYQLFLQTEEGLVPIKVSRLK